MLKQMFVNDNITPVIFDATIEEIHSWIESKINDSSNLFNLNEAYSCTAEIHDDNKIIISGDDDYLELTFQELVPITVRMDKYEE